MAHKFKNSSFVLPIGCRRKFPFRQFPKNSNKIYDNLEIDYKNIDIFHRAISPILFFSQCFAIMPITGVLNPNPFNTKFKLKSIPVMITVTFLLCGGLATISFLNNLIQNTGITAKSVVGLVFFSCGLSSCTLFLSLAPRWPRLICFWTNTEMLFVRAPYEPPKYQLSLKVRLAACLIGVLSTVEHGMFLSVGIVTYRTIGLTCNHTTDPPSYQGYINQSFPHIFRYISLNFVTATLVMIMNATFTIIWNYMDLFIMIISVGISTRFQQINHRIMQISGKEIHESIWYEIRSHHVKLCELIDLVDENLSSIILLSCLNNLYFICFQLLNIFNKLRWPINYIYFWYSLLYLLGRTGFVFMFTSNINDESKAALTILRLVPSSGWCSEIERFIMQITTQTVALTGMKLYHLTRKLLFSMIGTIVTYELVLLQFDEPNRVIGLPPLC